MPVIDFSYVIMAITESTLIVALGLALTGVRPRWPQLALIGFTQGVVACLVRMTPIPFGVHTILLTIIWIAIIRLVARVDWRVAAVAELVGFTIYLAIEGITVSLSLYLTGYSLGYVMKHPFTMKLFFLPTASIMGLLIWLILRFGFKPCGPLSGYHVNDSEGHALNRSYSLVYLLSAQPVFFLAVLAQAFFVYRTGAVSNRYFEVFGTGMALAVLAFAALTPLKIQAVSRTIGTVFAARKNEENLRHIGELLRLIRHQHHDFNHQLQVVYGLIETGCYKEASRYIKKAYENITVPSELIRTDNLHVTALLYTKLAIAEARQIRFEPVIECSLQELPLSDLEVGSVFGNLIDNALEEVQNVSPEKRLVQLEVTRDQENYLIKVANTGMSWIAHRSKLFQAGYTTKEGHAGLGLANVRDIIRRCGGDIAVDWDGTRMVFTVTIPVGKSGQETHISTKPRKPTIFSTCTEGKEKLCR
ncbi:MAG: GHKL domain-containing protein [Bacillota bacterium]